MRRIALFVVVTAGAVIATAAALVTAASAAQSPRSVRASMMRATAKEHSVHYVAASSSPGHAVRMVCDVASGRGIQRIAFTNHGRSGNATVLVVKRKAYIRGNAYTLHVYFGFAKAQARRYSGKWISIPHTNPDYPTVSAAATYASFLSFLFPQRKLRLVNATISGRRVVGVRGLATLEGSEVLETLYAPANGRPLPIEEKQFYPGHPGKGLTTMSRWNERVDVQAPAHSVPVSKVGGA
jgi:hypothetical protein